MTLATQHETGHNLKLPHSSQGSNAYGDETGFMGFSYSEDDGPRECYNTVKNWLLGWYEDRQAT
jgi:hypothetical protein